VKPDSRARVAACAPSLIVACEPSARPTRALARASTGIAGAVTAASAMPGRDAAGSSPPRSARAALTAT
jgi:hypothetical protein